MTQENKSQKKCYAGKGKEKKKKKKKNKKTKKT